MRSVCFAKLIKAKFHTKLLWDTDFCGLAPKHILWVLNPHSVGSFDLLMITTSRGTKQGKISNYYIITNVLLLLLLFFLISVLLLF